jgi:hypothetical protein
MWLRVCRYRTPEITMSSDAKQTEQPLPVPGPDDPLPVLGPSDPPHDLSREEAAYAREEQRLVRDYLGWVAVIRGAEVVGVYPTADEAILEGYRRFGNVRMIFKQIRDPNELPDFVSLVDMNHPSIKRLD